MKKVSVVLAEDHAFTLAGMQHALEADGRIVVRAAVPGGVAAIAAARRHQPDVAVLDHALADATGLEVFRELARWVPGTRTVIVTATPSLPVLRGLVQAGVHGLFTKAHPIAAVCDGIVAVAAGRTILPDDLRDRIGPGPDDPVLSPRETEVLHAIAEGLTNDGIAAKLAISPKTVESHRAALMRKLAVNSTASLLVAAVRGGHVDIATVTGPRRAT